MRLIDADALKEKGFADEYTGEGVVCVEDIDTAPTIDAVPVVRCNNCERQQICQLAQRLGNDGYCSEGEPK